MAPCRSSRRCSLCLCRSYETKSVCNLSRQKDRRGGGLKGRTHFVLFKLLIVWIISWQFEPAERTGVCLRVKTWCFACVISKKKNRQNKKLLTLPFLTRAEYILSGKGVYKASHEPSPAPQTPVNTQDTSDLCLEHKNNTQDCRNKPLKNRMWFLVTVVGRDLLALEKWRPRWASGPQLWRLGEEAAGPSPTGQRSPGPSGPSPASETCRHAQLRHLDSSWAVSRMFPPSWWVWFTWPAPGERSAGTVHRGWWAHSYVHRSRKPSYQKKPSASSLHQQLCNNQWCVTVKPTVEKIKS